jgi:hypothetical protein
MKSSPSVIAISFLALCYFGETTSAAPAWEKTCRKATKLARSVMEARQRGASIEAVLDAMGNLPKDFVYEAFEQPRYYTSANQDREVNEFGNQRFISCKKAFKTL